MALLVRWICYACRNIASTDRQQKPCDIMYRPQEIRGGRLKLPLTLDVEPKPQRRGKRVADLGNCDVRWKAPSIRVDVVPICIGSIGILVRKEDFRLARLDKRRDESGREQAKKELGVLSLVHRRPIDEFKEIEMYR
ncbi:hypothetical protein WN51_11071 [Melipona quadrifasciata]|uniref:Uncharacterized protein n=1 Tax=Melipona quadrifasciata TaxID=166423 RepID=A0A0M9A591_9HYME|nr:hypothetical protein WN51_11071 [Melipona quadrifasciata]